MWFGVALFTAGGFCVLGFGILGVSGVVRIAFVVSCVGLMFVLMWVFAGVWWVLGLLGDSGLFGFI